MKKMLVAGLMAMVIVGCNNNQAKKNEVVKRETVREIQTAKIKRLQFLLNEAGYEAGKVDGVVGVDTKGAIVRFFNDRDLNLLKDDYDAMIIELERKEIVLMSGTNNVNGQQ